MNPYLLWFFSYGLPVLIVWLLLLTIQKARHGSLLREGIVYGGLLASAVIAQIFMLKQGMSFPVMPSLISFLLFLAAVATSFILLSYFGLFYSLSAIIQQLSMISVIYLLSPFFSMGMLIMLIMPLYVVSHLFYRMNWVAKVLITSVWGIFTVLLFSIFADPFLNFTLHILGGSLFIAKKVLYAKKQAVRNIGW